MTYNIKQKEQPRWNTERREGKDRGADKRAGHAQQRTAGKRALREALRQYS
jgi:hypothetical protein